MNQECSPQVMLSSIPWPAKPTNDEVKSIIQDSFKIAQLTPEQLTKHLLNGETIRPGILFGGRGKANWVKQIYFFVDVDHNISIEEVLTCCARFEIKPFLIYKSMSYVEGQPGRFRVVFIANRTITDIEEREKIQRTLMFCVAGRDADWNTASAEKLFFGTTKGSYYEDFDAVVEADYILDCLYGIYYDADLKEQSRRFNEKLDTNIADSNLIYSEEEYDSRYPNVVRHNDSEYKCTDEWYKRILYILNCLQDYFEHYSDLSLWKDGCGRKVFLYWLYNLLCFTVDIKEATDICREYNRRFDVSLSSHDFWYALNRRHQKEERKRPDLHDKGHLIWADTLYKILLENHPSGYDAGLLSYDSEKERKDDCMLERDKRIAELFLDGLSYRTIADELSDEYGCSHMTVKNTVERLNIKDRNIDFDDIDFENNQRYTRKPDVKTLSYIQSTNHQGSYGNELINQESNTTNKDATFYHFYQKDCNQITDIDLFQIKPIDANTVCYRTRTGLHFFKINNPNEEVHSIKFDNTEDNIDHSDEYFDLIVNQGVNACITGKAGRGKTFFAKRILSAFKKKNVLCLAPTGAAANILNGKTVHSGLKVPVGRIAPDTEPTTASVSTLENVTVVIIDEIGCLRVDVFEYVVKTIKLAEAKYNKCIQLIVLGDFNQLPPVIDFKKEKEIVSAWKKYLGSSFKKGFAKESPLWVGMNFYNMVLSKNYRSGDDVAYSNLCDGVLLQDSRTLSIINRHIRPELMYAEADDITHICTKNEECNDINKAIINNHPEAEYLCGLGFKVFEGMKVIVKQNISGNFLNGTICTVTKIDKSHYKNYVYITNSKGKSRKINFFYEFKRNNKDIIEPAYAISVHACQGQTLNGRVIIHCGAEGNRECFAENQAYVALTRCKNESQISLVRPMTFKDLTLEEDKYKHYPSPQLDL